MMNTLDHIDINNIIHEADPYSIISFMWLASPDKMQNTFLHYGIVLQDDEDLQTLAELHNSGQWWENTPELSEILDSISLNKADLIRVHEILPENEMKYYLTQLI